MDKNLIEFLITAKKATYAGKGAETRSSRMKSHDLIYEDGDYMYYDTYLGTGRFAGEEALWIKGVPYWFPRINLLEDSKIMLMGIMHIIVMLMVLLSGFKEEKV